MGRAGSSGGGMGLSTSAGGSSGAYINKHLASPRQAKQRQARGSDPTDMMRSELFAAGNGSPRGAHSIDEGQPLSARAGSGGHGAPAAAGTGLAGASGTPRMRTADEIRQAYGRGPRKAEVRRCIYYVARLMGLQLCMEC